MYGHPIAKQLEGFWRDHAGRHDDPEWLLYLNAYDGLLRLKMAEMGEEHQNDGRFGMSKAGGCTRAAQLKLLGHASELTGSTRATFAIGHQVEVMALATMVALGYEITNVQGRAVIEPMMTSAIDAEMVLDGIRTLISVKSVGYKMSGFNYKSRTWTRHGFAQYPLDGVRRTNPGYWAQAQAELHAMEVSQSLFLVVAKDSIKKMEDDPILKQNGSLTFYAELISADELFVAGALAPTWRGVWQSVQVGASGKGLHIHKTENRYVEVAPNADNKAATGLGYDTCSYCDLRDACESETLQERLQASIEMAEARV